VDTAPAPPPRGGRSGCATALSLRTLYWRQAGRPHYFYDVVIGIALRKSRGVFA
jgi:hypothetical protein